MSGIICGDCVEIMKSFPDNIIDLTITSPPYDSIRYYSGNKFNYENIVKQLYRVTKLGGVVVWVVGDTTVNGTESGSSFKQALYFMEVGFNLHDTMIYKKNGIAFPTPTRYHQCFEYMFVFSKGKPKTTHLIKDKPNSQGGKTKKNRWERLKNGEIKFRDNESCTILPVGARWNIWEYDHGYNKSTLDKIAYKHPAIFPDKLAYDHIISWSNEGDIVLDPMCGSGTVCKQARILNRRFIGIDISSEYCEVAKERLKLI